MIQTIVSGIVLGLGLAIMLGPAFFSLIQTSIDRGFQSAVRLSLGIFLSDVFLVSLVFLGATSILGEPLVKEIVGLVGGGILVGIGLHTFLNRGKGQAMNINKQTAEEIEKIVSKELPKPIVYVTKGFLLNLANPATWFFWVFWVGIVSTQYTNSVGQVDKFALSIFFFCALLTVLGTDLLKAHIAQQLKNRLNEKFIAKINMGFGIVLIGFGVALVIKSIIQIMDIKFEIYL